MTVDPIVPEVDPLDVRRARVAPGLLRAFNDAGVLAAADVHVARRLTTLLGEDGAEVALAVALAVRGPRLGHVLVDLATIRETAAVDAEEAVDVSALPWPDAAGWIERVAASPLVGVGEEDDPDRPLRLIGSTLYLDRYSREERHVASDLLGLAVPAPGLDGDALAEGVRRLFTDDPGGRQALAAATAVRRRFAVVAGGPGTGKTTTVARLVALVLEQAEAVGGGGGPKPLVALAAPTGKAAARLEEAVHDEVARVDVGAPVREALLGLSASTLHRLLGWRAGSHSRFRHDRMNRLPHDLVVVDEASMVSLSLMARLVEAMRPDARLVLVGDPGQLTSIEAGAVLGDIVAGMPGEGITVLERIYRFEGAIARVADGIRRGDASATVEALRSAGDDVTWIEADPEEADVGVVRASAVAAGRAMVEAARTGDAARALTELGRFRVLCAHRRGAHGVSAWTAEIERWLADEVEGFGGEGAWYPGRPLLVTENDYALRLFNGDTGVVVSGADGRPLAAFERRGEVATVRPSRLGAVDTVHAMTVHKSQGSQFGTAAVLLPPPTAQLLTRELLYTAVTRAKDRLVLVGTERTVRAAVARPVARASGLAARLRPEVAEARTSPRPATS